MRISQTTFHDMPIVSRLLHWWAVVMLKIFGWRVRGRQPDAAKYVMLAAPHTSNWDGPVMLFIAFAMRIKIFFLVKKGAYRFPFRLILRMFGAIPIDRSKSHDLVAQVVEVFGRTDRIALIVAPEGTRGRVDYWKTGFYHIALGAKVPMALGFLDFKHKVGGLGPTIEPSGDLEADLAKIGEFYANITAKRPDCYSPPRAREVQERPVKLTTEGQ